MDAETLERLRENSGIRLDREGRFWHEGTLVEHPKVQLLFHQGLGRAPDGRATLTVGRTWCYLSVDDTLYLVRRAICRGEAGRLSSCELVLDDASTEPLSFSPGVLRLDEEGVLRVLVKQGREWARLSAEAQAVLGPWLVEVGEGWALQTVAGAVPVE